MKGPFLVVFELSTFRGISIGAEHWYGTLRASSKSDRDGIIRGGFGAWVHPAEKVELKRPMGEEEAAYLRDKDDFDLWQAGDLTSRFNSKEEVEAAALAAFAEHFAADDLLVKDRRDVMKAIAGPRADEFNALHERDQWKWLHESGFRQDKDWPAVTVQTGGAA